MFRQLSLFLRMEKSESEKRKKVVKASLHSLLNKALETERKEKENATDYSMTNDILTMD